MVRRSHLAGLLIWLALGGFPGFSQVAVSVKLDRSEYLAGEPVFVIVEAKNVGTEAVGYSKCDGHVDLTVPGGQTNQPPNLHGCFRFEGVGGGVCGIDHPPLLAPGKSASFRYLLKGYHLKAGEYDLHASGKAGVRWFFGVGRNESAVSNRKYGDPVEGALFDVWLRLFVREGTEDELRLRYAPYLEFAASGSTEALREAREAIAEMAPPFLEKTILGFANQPDTAPLAAKGLQQIPTAESRADLIGLYEKSSDLTLRASIVRGLAGIGTASELPFFDSLLPGHSSALDDAIRIPAALGIGRVGGEAAVEILRAAPRNLNPDVRGAVAEALGNTRSASAIPVLIGMYADEHVRNDVCLALSTLTHRAWCDGRLPAEEQVKWRQWLKGKGSSLKIYGAGECVELRELAPLID